MEFIKFFSEVKFVYINIDIGTGDYLSIQYKSEEYVIVTKR